MKNTKRKLLAGVLTAALAVSTLVPVSADSDFGAVKSVKLTRRQVTVSLRGKTKLSLKAVKHKVKWTVKNKKIVKIIRRIGKKKNVVVLKGLKVGRTKVTAIHDGRKLVFNVQVKKVKKTVVNEQTTTYQEQTTTEQVTTIQETTTEQETTSQEEITTEQETTSQEETTTEQTTQYPGQNEGWSPIVSPDDL